MAWITTKDGKHINTDWFDKDKQIAQNKAEADKLNADKEMSRKELLAKFVDKDDYSNQQDYRQLSDEHTDLAKQDRELEEKLNELKGQLDKETSLKPKEKWTTEDEINALLGAKPLSYTDKGKELQKEYTSLLKQQESVRQQMSGLREKMERIQTKNAMKEIEKWEKERPAFQKGDANKDYPGFQTKTNSGYDTELKQGKGFIAEMSPKEYLQRISYDVFNKPYSHVVKGTDTKNIQKYMKMMKSGTKMDMPSLIVGKGQEGRHRAMAAFLLGYKKIPVYVQK